jgi:hypothetical protein
VFSFHSRQGYFRLVRRAGRWYVEFDGLISRTFHTAEEAAAAVSHCQSGLRRLRRCPAWSIAEAAGANPLISNALGVSGPPWTLR